MKIEIAIYLRLVLVIDHRAVLAQFNSPLTLDPDVSQQILILQFMLHKIECNLLKLNLNLRSQSARDTMYRTSGAPVTKWTKTNSLSFELEFRFTAAL